MTPSVKCVCWVRRCDERWQDGRFVLEQETNAYAVLPETQWRGYKAPETKEYNLEVAEFFDRHLGK